MPRVEFVEENIQKSGPGFPKFVLDRGETARIVLLEQPWAEYVHELRKPKLVNGVPQKETKKRKDGSTWEDYEYDFVGRVLCLGDEGILREAGSDPSSCPICAEAARSDRFHAPKVRYAMHVVRYDLQPGSTQVNDDPFGARAQVWAFTDKIFAELYDLKKEWGDLRAHDLILSRDQNAAFANVYKITVAQKAEWMADDKRQKLVGAVMKPENLAKDLSEFCGRRKPEKNIEFDIRAVNEAWDIASGTRSVSAADAALANVGGAVSLVDGLDDLLTAQAPAPAVDEAGWAVASEDNADDGPALDFDALANSVASDAGTEGGPTDIDKLLAGL
jgi:hypothetical protein